MTKGSSAGTVGSSAEPESSRAETVGSSAEPDGSALPPLDYGYGSLPTLNYTSHSLVKNIWDAVEEKLHLNFDYLLIHIYDDGKASIGWHNDKEALNSNIVSLSFGASRKFRLKPIGMTRGWTDEYLLSHGDLFLMKGPREDKPLGCQRLYLHTVPVEAKVKGSRINMTFRVSE